MEPGPAPLGAARSGAAAGARLRALGRSAWPVRVAWALLPLLAGPALGDALGGTSRPVQVVASVGLWAAWAGVLVATLVPTTVSLTVLRVAAPAAVAAAGAALLFGAGDGGGGGEGSVGTLAGVVALAVSLVAALVALSAATAETFVDGSSYGDERRLPLRTPTPLLAGPVEVAWFAVVAPAVAGPLLLAAHQWVAGAVVLAAGVPLAVRAARSLHTLARRWVVFVPAGMVLHDPLALAEPILVPRASVRSLEPAPAGTDALDLTGGAAGLAVEARTVEPVTLLPVAPRGRPTELTEVTAVMFTPVRPGRLLAEARRRRIGGR